MTAVFQITICPTCGSDKIRQVRRDVRGTFQGQAYIVPALEFYECPVCGEKVYDRQAMQMIETYSAKGSRVRPDSNLPQAKPRIKRSSSSAERLGA